MALTGVSAHTYRLPSMFCRSIRDTARTRISKKPIFLLLPFSTRTPGGCMSGTLTPPKPGSRRSDRSCSAALGWRCRRLSQGRQVHTGEAWRLRKRRIYLEQAFLAGAAIADLAVDLAVAALFAAAEG